MGRIGNDTEMAKTWTCGRVCVHTAIYKICISHGVFYKTLGLPGMLSDSTVVCATPLV